MVWKKHEQRSEPCWYITTQSTSDKMVSSGETWSELMSNG